MILPITYLYFYTVKIFLIGNRTLYSYIEPQILTIPYLKPHYNRVYNRIPSTYKPRK